MTSKIISLSPIYTTALLESDKSFVKSVSSGTGLGKTWSAAKAVAEHIQNKIAANNFSPLIAILAAPQHNQLNVDPATIKELNLLGCEVIKVRPISTTSLSNIQSEMNAYDISKSLFFDSNGKVNDVFNQLRASFKEFDQDMVDQKSKKELGMLKRIDHLRYHILTIQREVCIKPSAASDHDINEDDHSDEINAMTKSRNINESKGRIDDSMIKLSKILTSICEQSYFNEHLFSITQKRLSNNSKKLFHEVCASFFPFMHIQRSPGSNFLLAMTVSKMIVRHSLLCPTYIDARNNLRWSKREVTIDSIASDMSDLSVKSESEILKYENNLGLIHESEHSSEVKVLRSDFIFFIDESDASKEKISEKLSFNLQDSMLIQAIGALAKETGDVFAKNAYVSIREIVENNPEDNLAKIFMDHESDDSIPRIIAKETLLAIRKKIYGSLIESNWPNLNGAKTVDDMVNRINLFLKNSMTAPYCAVEKSIDSEVFSSTSAFGGEVYGFTGSKNIDNYIVVNMGGSFRVAEKSREKSFSSSSLPMSYFMLLISECYLYFRLIIKNQGTKKSTDEEVRKIDLMIAQEDRKSFISHIKSAHSKQEGSLSGISKPFLDDKDQHGNKKENEVLHTSVAKQTIFLSNKIAEDLFEKAFSDGKNLASIIDNDLNSMSSAKSSVIDMHYAYIKGHTIYGMAQAHDEKYQVREGCNHVVFPSSFRSMSAEQYIAKLLENRERKNAVFLLSATGGFENNHISAFSLSSLNYLAGQVGALYIPMSKADYEITKLKQDERSELKRTKFEKSEDIQAKGFVDAIFSIHHKEIDEYKRREKSRKSEGTLDNKKDNITKIDFRDPKKNIHKRSEMINAWSAIDYTHNNLSNHEGPAFSLALTQSNRNLLLSLKILSNTDHFTYNSRGYTVQRCISSNEATRDDFSVGDSYGIYIISSEKEDQIHRTKFTDPEMKETIIVCYSSGLEKALPKLLRDTSSSEKSDSMNLKELMGLDRRIPFEPSSDINFNAMDYLLSGVHGKNVIVISPYGAGARGINYIVNNDGVSARLISAQIRNNDSIKASQFKKRDLDAVFVCLAPYYSEVRPKLPSNKMDKENAQKVFFNNCQMYLYYIEFLARKFQIEGEDPSYNDDVDLSSCKLDHKAQHYFEAQSSISLFAMLQQSLGRLERTIAKQTQVIFMPREAYKAFHDGLGAIVDSMSDRQIDQIIGCMSVINSRLSNELLINPEDYLPRQITSINDFIIEDQNHKIHEFENFKTYLIRAYASSREVNDDLLNNHKPMEVYEALRSWSIWTEGVSSYIEKIRSKVLELDIPKEKIDRFVSVVDNLFFTTDQPIEQYRTKFISVGTRHAQIFNSEGNVYDFDSDINRKRFSKINPYHEDLISKHRYISPWFIADINGNYGEMILSLSIDILRSNPSIEILDRTTCEGVRKSYEYADFFVKSKKSIIAIDAKHLGSALIRENGLYSGKNISEEFKEKMGNNLSTIEGHFKGCKVSLIAINTTGDGTSSNTAKKIIEGQAVYTRDGDDSPEGIARVIVNLFNSMENFK